MTYFLFKNSRWAVIERSGGSRNLDKKNSFLQPFGQIFRVVISESPFSFSFSSAFLKRDQSGLARISQLSSRLGILLQCPCIQCGSERSRKSSCCKFGILRSSLMPS